MPKISIVGAGAFGSALSIYAKKSGYDVSVWCFEKDLPAIVKEKGENEDDQLVGKYWLGTSFLRNSFCSATN